MVYFVQNVQKYRRYKEFEIYVEISTGTTISQEMLKQTVNKNNIHVPVGVSQVSQLVVMILLINEKKRQAGVYNKIHCFKRNHDRITSHFSIADVAAIHSSRFESLDLKMTIRENLTCG